MNVLQKDKCLQKNRQYVFSLFLVTIVKKKKSCLKCVIKRIRKRGEGRSAIQRPAVSPSSISQSLSIVEVHKLSFVWLEFAVDFMSTPGSAPSTSDPQMRAR